MTTWSDYGLAGLVLGVVLWMQRSQTKYIQDLTDRVVNSQIEFTKNLERKYEQDLDKISASLIILQERSGEQLELHKKIADCQVQILNLQQQIDSKQSWVSQKPGQHQNPS